MSQSSKGYHSIRILLLAGLVGGLVPACDSTRTVDPASVGSRLQPPDHADYGQVPSGFSATAVSWNQISISWARSPSATGYQVFRSTTGVTGSYALLASTSTATSHLDTGLMGSTEYCYEIRSIKTAGKNTSYSTFSTPLCATTFAPPVVAPSATDAIPDAGRIQVKWKDNSADEDGFHIEQASSATGPWVQAVNAVANATSANVYDVTAEQQACFRVIAFNATGPSLPSTPDCTTLPATPTNLSVQASDQQSVTLSWIDNSPVEDGYKVSRAAGAYGLWTDIVSLPPNAVSYRDAGLTPDISYRYRVQALKDGGFSQVSNEAIGVASTAVPAAPINAAAAYYPDTEGYGWNYLVIWWSDASTNEQGFRVEYSADGTSGWGLYGTTDSDNTYFQQQSSVFDPPPPGGCYRVIAFNSIGPSNPSNVVCMEPGGDPTDLTATAIDQQSIDLAWTDNAHIETGYAVIRSTGPDGPYEVVATLPANTTAYHDSGLSSGQDYWYAVAAIYSESGWSNYSNFTGATTLAAGASIQSSPNVITGSAGPKQPVRVKGLTPRVLPRRDSRRRR